MLHWYSFSFIWTEASGGFSVGNSIAGLGQPQVNRSVIEKARAAIDAPETATLLACSYLGFMPRDEFESGDD